MSDLIVSRLHVAMEGAHIIQDVSLRVPRGTTIAVAGHNGAGKTTLVRSIMGLAGTILSGQIHFAGAEITASPAWTRAACGLCYVPQSRRIFPSLTVEEHLLVAQRPPREAMRRWTQQDIFDLFPNLASRRKSRGGLSGGEQQMLAIARALVGNPLTIILDEPTEGLAPAIITRVLDALKQLKREGLGILLVEQNYRFAASLADEVYIQQAGRIVFHGASLDAGQIAAAAAGATGFATREFKPD